MKSSTSCSIAFLIFPAIVHPSGDASMDVNVCGARLNAIVTQVPAPAYANSKCVSIRVPCTSFVMV